MGSSGAGKTTMMNILAQRNLGGLQIGGTLRANGQPYDYKIGNISSYVQQDDIFVGSLTVKGSGHSGIWTVHVLLNRGSLIRIFNIRCPSPLVKTIAINSK